MLIDKDVPMTTRDGVILRADVYRPDGAGRFPVLLSRLPYDKNGRRRPGRHRHLRRARLRRDHAGHARPLRLGRRRVLSADLGGGRTDTTRWSGRRSSRMPTARSARWASPISAPRSTCSRPRGRRTSRRRSPPRRPADFHQCWVYHTGGAFELGWQIPYAILMARDTIARAGAHADAPARARARARRGADAVGPAAVARGVPAATPHGLGRASRAGCAVSR